MNVHELIEKLQQIPDKDRVVVLHDYEYMMNYQMSELTLEDGLEIHETENCASPTTVNNAVILM